MYIVKYSKSVYQSKVTELEGYLTQLGTHYSRMETLKSHMYDFWDDNNARKAGEALSKTIEKVKLEMDRTQDMIRIFKQAIEEMNGVDGGVGDLLDEVLGTILKL